jgi:voltage-gated potassium channel
MCFPFYGCNFVLLRLLRISKVLQFTKADDILFRVLYRTKAELAECFVLFCLTAYVLAAIMYVIEGASNPSMSTMFSCLWWACVTITTVGYGDIVPMTIVGKLVAMCSMFVGILFFALPTSILGAAWLEELKEHHGV